MSTVTVRSRDASRYEGEQLGVDAICSSSALQAESDDAELEKAWESATARAPARCPEEGQSSAGQSSARRKVAAARGARLRRKATSEVQLSLAVQPPPLRRSSSSSSGSRTAKCDKCDGSHATDACPHYRKARGVHRDAQKSHSKQLGADSGPPIVARRARVVPQPPDGSCLFHSLSYGLRDGHTATALRREIASFIRHNPNLTIADTPLKDWIQWDAFVSVATYASRMSRGGWGGGIEMAATSELKNVSVEVYEPCAAGFRRISVFHKPGAEKVVRVCYRGGVHYDALVI